MRITFNFAPYSGFFKYWSPRGSHQIRDLGDHVFFICGLQITIFKKDNPWKPK